MRIDGFTVVLGLFLAVMYGYLYLIKKSIQFPTISRFSHRYRLLGLSFLLLVIILAMKDETYNEMLRSFLTWLVLAGFLFHTKGLAEDRIYIRLLDNQGVPYPEIEKIVLLQKGDEIRMNYFRNGRRGPLLIFKAPLEEIILFLSDKMNDDAEVDILFDEEK